MLRGMASALYAFAVFFVIAGAALPRASLPAAFALATAAALIAQGATLRLLRRPLKMEDAAEGGIGRVFASPRLITRAPGLLGAVAVALVHVTVHHVHDELCSLRHQHASKHAKLVLLRIVEAGVKGLRRVGDVLDVGGAL